MLHVNCWRKASIRSVLFLREAIREGLAGRFEFSLA
jgi:hypothetical protein